MDSGDCEDWVLEELLDLGGAKPSKSAADRRVARKQWEARLDSFSGLSFFIGGFFGTSEEYTLTAKNGYVHGTQVLFPGFYRERAYCETPFGGGEGWTLAEFCGVLRRTLFGGWEEHYDNPHVCDGESWSLKIEFSDGGPAFESSGSNKNPRGLGVLKRKLGVGIEPDSWFNEGGMNSAPEGATDWSRG